MPRYLVIENFRPGQKDKVNARFQQCGRLLPDGLHYIDSWRETGGNRCFQLMETDDYALFRRWTAHWDDLVDFEILPVED